MRNEKLPLSQKETYYMSESFQDLITDEMFNVAKAQVNDGLHNKIIESLSEDAAVMEALSALNPEVMKKILNGVVRVCSNTITPKAFTVGLEIGAELQAMRSAGLPSETIIAQFFENHRQKS